jgi:hypothetical protein
LFVIVRRRRRWSSDGAHIISAVAFWMLVSGEEWCRNAREVKK